MIRDRRWMTWDDNPSFSVGFGFGFGHGSGSIWGVTGDQQLGHR